MTHYIISTKNKLIFMQIRGELSAKKIISFLNEVSIDEKYNRSYNSILDLQSFDNILTAKEAQSIIESAAIIRGGASAKSAVITNSIFRKNLVDLVSDLSTKKALQVKGFTSMTEACSWLEIDEKVIN